MHIRIEIFIGLSKVVQDSVPYIGQLNVSAVEVWIVVVPLIMICLVYDMYYVYTVRPSGSYEGFGRICALVVTYLKQPRRTMWRVDDRNSLEEHFIGECKVEGILHTL